MSENKLITFIDNIGRIVIGKEIVNNENVLTVEDPAVIAIINDGNVTKALVVQPLMRELFDDVNHKVELTYSKSSIAIANDIEYNYIITKQYTELMKELPIKVDPKGDTSKTVNLFGDINE